MSRSYFEEGSPSHWPSPPGTFLCCNFWDYNLYLDFQNPRKISWSPAISCMYSSQRNSSSFRPHSTGTRIGHANNLAYIFLTGTSPLPPRRFLSEGVETVDVLINLDRMTHGSHVSQLRI